MVVEVGIKVLTYHQGCDGCADGDMVYPLISPTVVVHGTLCHVALNYLSVLWRCVTLAIVSPSLKIGCHTGHRETFQRWEADGKTFQSG